MHQMPVTKHYSVVEHGGECPDENMRKDFCNHMDILNAKDLFELPAVIDCKCTW